MFDQTEQLHSLNKEALDSILHELAAGFDRHAAQNSPALEAILALVSVEVKHSLFDLFKEQTSVNIESVESLDAKTLLQLFAFLSKNTMSLRTNIVSKNQLEQMYTIAHALRMFFITLDKNQLSSTQR